MNNKDFNLTKQNGDELTKPRFNLMINPSNMGFDRDLTLTNTCMNHEPITNKRWGRHHYINQHIVDTKPW